MFLDIHFWPLDSAKDDSPALVELHYARWGEGLAAEQLWPGADGRCPGQQPSGGQELSCLGEQLSGGREGLMVAQGMQMGGTQSSEQRGLESLGLWAQRGRGQVPFWVSHCGPVATVSTGVSSSKCNFPMF